MVLRNIGASFLAKRVNASTFAIIEDDSYGEHPVMYAKIYEDPPMILLSDTGCDSPSERSKRAEVTKLRDFLEAWPLEDNDGLPLNYEGQKPYCLIITHCHYDHIGGINQFNDPSRSDRTSTVIASYAGRDFIRNDLWEHSLCKIIGLPPPRYEPTIWARSGSNIMYTPDEGVHIDVPHRKRSKDRHETSLGIYILNTPGHTPDEIAWYDVSERHLYVGDSFYQSSKKRDFPGSQGGAAIEFPKEGDWSLYMDSMNRLLTFVRRTNGEDPALRVRVGCAHITMDEDAETMLVDVISLFERILEDDVRVIRKEERRGEMYYTWGDAGRPYIVRAPVRLKRTFKRSEAQYLGNMMRFGETSGLPHAS